MIDWNSSTVTFPLNKSIISFFEEQVERTLEATAIYTGKQILTYREINERANQIAHYLNDYCHIQPEVLVAVLADRSEWTIIAMLGILKSGGVYVPIDAEYPADRITYILEDSKCKVLLRCNNDQKIADSWKGLVLDVEAITAASFNPKFEISSQQLAYVIYTSGSTGKPKGVMVEHCSLINVTLDHIRAFKITNSDRILQFSSPSFDASLFQIFIAFLQGAMLVLLDKQILDDSRAFLSYVNEHQITVLSLPPLYLNTLNHAEFPSVRLLNTGGDAAITDDALFYSEKTVYFNTYGPTEATICSAYYLVDTKKNYSKGIPIGKPISNASMYILNSSLELVHEGEIGQICISGLGLARGYLHKPDLTTEKFIPHPFKIGERLYLTGDMGMQLFDGNIQFVGRKDNQVKVRGYRIELEEIERHLSSHPAVEKAVVLTKDFGKHTKELVAYILSKQVDFNELRNFLGQLIPSYMIPGYYIILDQFPQTANDKIDKQALSTLDVQVSCTEYLAPRNALEEQLAKIWQTVLVQDRIGVSDNFFQLGGHSLRAIQIISLVRQNLGLDMSLKDIFNSPTIAQLAQSLKNRELENTTRIKPLPFQDTYDLSHAQRRLWVLDRMEESSSAYNITQSFWIEGNLNVTAFNAALYKLIERHEALRTTFLSVDGHPQQIIHHQIPFNLEIIDLRTEDKPINLAKNYAKREAVTPFDLLNPPLLRATLLHINEQTWVFLLTLHHTICDGWSMKVLANDLAKLYTSLSTGEACSLKSLEFQYKEFAGWQNALLMSDYGTQHRDYWLSKLSGDLPTLGLPTDFPRPAQRKLDGETIFGNLDSTLTYGLKNLSRKGNVSLFMTLLAVVKVLLFRYTEQTDIIVGIPVSQRDSFELSEQIGFYVNTIVLRDKIKGSERFQHVLQNIKQTCIEAYSHQIYPFDKLVEQLQLPRDLSHSPIFDVMVAMQDAEDICFKLPDMHIQQFTQSFNGSKFDLSFDFVEQKEQISVFLEYSTNLFQRDTIERLFEHFKLLVSSVLLEPSLPIEYLNILPESEKKKILQNFNGKTVLYPTNQTILDIFNRCVKEQPDCTAIIFQGRKLTYQQVEDYSNRVAHHILSHYSVAANNLIGIFLNRSERFFIAMLGVLKTGAAYVPIDPIYPGNRIKYILNDAKCKIVITEESVVHKLDNIIQDIILIESIETKRSSEECFSCSLATSPEHLAYCIYTSGSTGYPKGVIVNHANALNAFYVWQHDYSLNRPVSLQLASFAFDVSFGDFCRSLLAEGTLVIASEQERIDPDSILHLIRQYSVTIFETTPLIAKLLVDCLTIRGQSMPFLEFMIVGSDSWSMSEFEKLRSLLQSNTRLLNSYGTTEATVDSTYYEHLGNLSFSLNSHYVPIGKPMSNVEILITNDNLNLVPIGIQGEICIAGSGVACGYLNNELLTATKFVPHPFKKGEKLYRTGDLGYWLTDGNIAIRGRKDNQIKIRGYRIDLGEIENTLLAHPEISQAAVVTIEAENNTKDLVAYIVANQRLSSRTLRKYLAQSLPYYMFPSHYVFLEVLPSTPNGKIDRQALSAADIVQCELESNPTEPTQYIEQLLIEIWQQVLPTTRKIGISDSFFSLGGDSLIVIQLVQKAQTRGIIISPSDIFQNSTIAELGEHIETNALYGKKRVPVPLSLVTFPQHLLAMVDENCEDIYPASQMQQLMLQCSLYNVDSDGIYHGQSSWHIQDETLSLPALKQALKHMVLRHHALRTVFIEEQDGSLFQLVKKELAVEISEHDLSSLSPHEQESKLEQLLQSDRKNHFTIGNINNPLYRFSMLLRSSKSFELFMSIHHAIDDGWGFVEFQNDLIEDYLALKEGKELKLTTPVNTIKEFIALEKEILLSKEARSFWEDELLLAQPMLLQVQSPSNQGEARFDTFQYDIDIPSSNSIHNLARELEVSTKAIFLAAYLTLIKELTSNEIVTVGVVSNGRSERLTNPFKAMGLFWNIIPFCHSIQEILSIDTKEIQGHLNRIEPYARYPLPQILKNRGGIDDLFFACFNFIHFHNQKPFPVDKGLQLLNFRMIDKFHYPLTLAVCVDSFNQGITLRFEYNRFYFSQDFIGDFSQQLTELIVKP